ncbi:MAG: GNAT family N-acetyltransferase [Methylococcus sp.]|nr:GNAT family N-acetyltransferase [Methylococcus sp.]
MQTRIAPALIEPETERLRLRQWRESDLEPFARLNADPRVMEYFPRPLVRAESDALAGRIAALIEQRSWGFWAAELKASGEFIGFVGLHVPSAELPFSPCVEIGWRLDFRYWGYGYATEAAEAALHVGFAGQNLTEIVAFTAVDNLRSRAVMRRLGMRPDPQTFQHPAVPAGSPLREHCLYRLGRGEWMERQPETAFSPRP